MELFRAITYATIGLDSTSVNASDTTYRNDSALGGSLSNDVTVSCSSPLPNQCLPTRTLTGSDRRTYRVDTYVTQTTPTNGRTLKLLTVVVREGKSPFGALARAQSTFDQSTGVSASSA